MVFSHLYPRFGKAKICNIDIFHSLSCRPRIKIPACIVMPIAHMVNWTYKLLGPYGMPVPQFTPSRIRLLSCCRTFNSSKAKDRLFYTPIVPLQVLHVPLVAHTFCLCMLTPFLNSLRYSWNAFRLMMCLEELKKTMCILLYWKSRYGNSIIWRTKSIFWISLFILSYFFYGSLLIIKKRGRVDGFSKLNLKRKCDYISSHLISSTGSYDVSGHFDVSILIFLSKYECSCCSPLSNSCN